MNTVDILLTAVTPKWKIFENEINKSMCFHSFRRGCFVIQTLSLSHSFIISTDTYTCGGNERDREAHTHIYIQLFGEITRRRRRWEGKHETKEFLRINPRPINVSDSEKKATYKIYPAGNNELCICIRACSYSVCGFLRYILYTLKMLYIYTHSTHIIYSLKDCM